MFTGIVTELGTVTAADPIDGGTSLSVAANTTLDGLTTGDSVAINGVCLTVVDQTHDTFTVQVVEESLERTAIGALDSGSPVNLERPMSASGRFDGHIVQGHVDGVGVVTSIGEEGDGSRIRVTLPGGLERYVVEKGSVTVDGTSLTVTAVSDRGADEPWFEIVLIPYTLSVTGFGTARVGTAVNLEVDIIAKYVERMLGGRT